MCFHFPRHPVASIPYSLLSWGFLPFGVSKMERPFSECRNTRSRSSCCATFPSSRFLTSLTFYSAPCLPGFFHPVTPMGFTLQRFSPPTSLNASRHPYLPSVHPFRASLSRFCSGRRSVSGATVSSHRPARSSLELPTTPFSLLRANSSYESLPLWVGPSLQVGRFLACSA